MPPAPYLGVELVISGWAHTPFGKHQATLEDLISIVVRDAIAHAGLDRRTSTRSSSATSTQA